jgi:hypothetical protein
VVKRIGLYPPVQADTFGAGVVSQSGGVTLVETVRAAGLDRALSVALARWCKPMAIHDPGKVITDLAIALALGGDCLATSRCCALSPRSLAAWPRTRRCRARSTRWRRTRRAR